MENMTERERSFYLLGLHTGIDEAMKEKPTLSVEVKEEIERVISLYLDARISVYVERVDSFYKKASWYEKLPWLKRSLPELEEQLRIDRNLISFLAFMRSVGLPLFLKHIEKAD